ESQPRQTPQKPPQAGQGWQEQAPLRRPRPVARSPALSPSGRRRGRALPRLIPYRRYDKNEGIVRKLLPGEGARRNGRTPWPPAEGELGSLFVERASPHRRRPYQARGGGRAGARGGRAARTGGRGAAGGRGGRGGGGGGRKG